ncbi:MAG: hypothetical protein JO112_06375 [Planctomycetes bacterium]|nr:hypothetical protein [Planctomycetota bacterium]
MIQMPRRSVTRFFIPLIDVMTLLFCIFLLMPMVKGKGGPASVGNPTAPESVGDVARTQPAPVPEQELQELAKIRTEKIQELEKRLAIRILEIDPDNGRLFYYDPDRKEIPNEAAAHALIQRQRQAIERQGPGRELYYLFLFPRQVTGFPSERQVNQYNHWFAEVAHGMDNPRGQSQQKLP